MQNYEDVRKKRKTQQIDNIWEQLPIGPLVEIAEQFTNFEDFEALHLVCNRWNSALRDSHYKFLTDGHVGHYTFQVPWLLMADQERGAESNVSFTLRSCSAKSNTMKLFFYRLSFDRVHQMPVRLPPQLYIDQHNFSNWSFLSSRGWLFVVTKGLAMSLYNPLCGTTHNYYIPLPRNNLLATHANRFALSACPCTNSYTVMLAFGKKMVFWRPGDEDWIFASPLSESGFFLDVTFYKGHNIALDNFGQVYMIYNEDKDGHCGKKFQAMNIATLFPECTYRYFWRAYFVLVESSQKLLVVVRVPVQTKRQPYFVGNHDHVTLGFQVMELFVPRTPIVNEVMEQPLKEVKDLGNVSLFVGRNNAFAVEVPHSENGVNVSPSYYGCKPNCIYFTDDRLLSRPTTADCGKGKDMGVYNMVDGSIARHFQGESLGDYSPMLWV